MEKIKGCDFVSFYLYLMNHRQDRTLCHHVKEGDLMYVKKVS